MKKRNRILIILLLILTLCASGCGIFDLGDLINRIEDSTQYDETIQSVNISGETKVIAGNSIVLTATVSPATASQAVIWSSSDESIAIVNNKGMVTGVSEGNVTIRATSKVNNSIYKTINIIVEPSDVDPTAITIHGNESVYVGNSTKFTISTVPETANKHVTWEVDDSTIASINYEGLLTAKKAGSVIVTARYNEEVYNTIEVTILNKTKNPQKISLKGYDYMYVNEISTMEYSVLPNDAIDGVTWEVSDNELATVDESGRIKALKEGVVTVTARSIVSDQVFSSKNITIYSEPKTSNIESMSLQDQVKNAINYTRKSVFGVINYQYSNNTNSLAKYSIGSGFVYSAWAVLNDGTVVTDINSISDLNTVSKYCYYLITNRHVVEGSEMLKLYIGEFDKYIDASLCQYDDKIDIAVVYFEYHDYIKPLVLADSTKVETGDFMVAIGNPQSLDFYDTSTFGIVSNPLRYYSIDTDGDGIYDWDQAYIQHDVAINPGNSGGPLINMSGEVVGINTMKLATIDIDTMGFSIPTSAFVSLLGLLEKGIKPERALLGVNVIEVKKASDGKLYTSQTNYVTIPLGLDYGLYVSAVDATGTAGKAGVVAGDIILSIDDIDLYEGHQVRLALGKFIIGSGDTATLVIYRDNQVVKLTLTF